VVDGGGGDRRQTAIRVLKGAKKFGTMLTGRTAIFGNKGENGDSASLGSNEGSRGEKSTRGLAR